MERYTAKLGCHSTDFLDIVCMKSYRPSNSPRSLEKSHARDIFHHQTPLVYEGDAVPSKLLVANVTFSELW